MMIKTTLSLLLISLSGTVLATPNASNYDMAVACASEFRDQTGHHAYEVVKTVSRSGPGSFVYWMNAHDEDLGAYCVTKAGKVAATYLTSAWRKTQTYHPRVQQLTVASAR